MRFNNEIYEKIFPREIVEEPSIPEEDQMVKEEEPKEEPIKVEPKKEPVKEEPKKEPVKEDPEEEPQKEEKEEKGE